MWARKYVTYYSYVCVCTRGHFFIFFFLSLYTYHPLQLWHLWIEEGSTGTCVVKAGRPRTRRSVLHTTLLARPPGWLFFFFLHGYRLWWWLSALVATVVLMFFIFLFSAPPSDGSSA